MRAEIQHTVTLLRRNAPLLRAAVTLTTLFVASTPAFAQTLTTMDQVRNLTSSTFWSSITVIAGIVGLGFCAFAVYSRDASYLKVPAALGLIFWVGPELIDLALTQGEASAGALAGGAP